MEIVGNPEIEQLSRLDGNPLNSSLPSHLVKAAEWDDWIDEDEEDLRLIDLGECFLQGEEPERLAQPGGLQAPETLLTNSFDYRVDLWRVGITVSLSFLTIKGRGD